MVGDGWVNNGPLAAVLDLDGHLAALVLICDERRDIGLDAASAEANDNNGRHIAAKRRAVLDRDRECGSPKDEQSNPVDTAEDEDSLVLAQVLVGDNGAQNWCDWEFVSIQAWRVWTSLALTVAEKLEEHVQASGALMAKAETRSSLGAVGRVVDVVLKETLGAVIGEAFAQLHYSDQKGRRWQILAYTSQVLLLVLVRLLALSRLLAAGLQFGTDIGQLPLLIKSGNITCAGNGRANGI